MIRIGLILLAICSLQHLSAQSFRDYSFVKFGLDDGLPSNSVFSVCQDNEGRIWLGTETGLAYLENGRFHHLDIEGIPKLVLAVYACADGGIYVIGNSPSVIIKLHEFSIVKVLHSLENKKFTGPLLQFIPEQQAIYYSDWNVVMRCTESGLDTVADIFGAELRSFAVSKQGEIVLTKSNGLHGVIDGFEHPINAMGAGYSLYSHGDTLISIRDSEIQFYCSDLKPDRSIPIDVDNSMYFAHATISRDGHIWFSGLLEGLYFLDHQRVVSVHHEINADYTQFSEVYEDQKGNIWLGTNGDGVFLLRKTNFSTISTSKDLSDEHIKSVSAYKEHQKLVVTRSGAHFVSDNKKVTPISLKVGDTKVPSTLINYLTPTPIGTFAGTSFAWRRRVSDGTINDSFPIISCFSSAGLLEKKYMNFGAWGKYTRLEYDPIDLDVLHDSLVGANVLGKVIDLTKIDSGIVIATDDKIYYRNTDEGKQRVMDGISENESIKSIQLDQNDSLWCLSINGLYYWNGNRWKHAKTSLIPKGAILEDLAIDQDNRFWIGSQMGLILIDGFHSSVMATYDGLTGNEITSLYYDHSSHKLWIGTKTGLSIGRADLMAEKQQFTASIQFDSITTLSGIKIESPVMPRIAVKEKLINVYLSTKKYFSPAPISYRYRLKGISNRWFDAPSGVVTFPALGAGNYSLEVGAKSLGGKWSENVMLHFQIERSFWTRWEVYFVMTLLVLALTALIYTERVKRIRKREREKRQIAATINELEMKALNANMNPHFIFNSLNSIQHYLIPLKNRKAFDFIANLSRLIRLNMAALGHKQVSLEGELKRTELYVNLERERLNNRLQFEIRTELEKERQDYQIPSMIIQPLVENSIWHGIAPLEGMGKIVLSITHQASFLIIQVTDNGVGLTQSAQNKNKSHDSVATKLTQDRLKHHHTENSFELKELFDENAKVIGTQATMKIHMSA